MSNETIESSEIQSDKITLKIHDSEDGGKENSNEKKDGRIPFSK